MRAQVRPAAQWKLVDVARLVAQRVGEGAQRYWLTYVGRPGDGTVPSPTAEWADEIVERLRLSEAAYTPAGRPGARSARAPHDEPRP